MSTISQWAVYQMCQTLDNNYSYILRIVKDVYPELYSESPTYDWERKSILGCFHKRFKELIEELGEKDVEREKQKPFQWSNWKESTDKEIQIIDLTHSIPTNWKIYKLYQKNEGNCSDVLDMLKKKYPNFAIPDDSTDEELCNVIREISEKVQLSIESRIKEKMKKEKATRFTWESKKDEEKYSPPQCSLTLPVSQRQTPSPELKSSLTLLVSQRQTPSPELKSSLTLPISQRQTPSPELKSSLTLPVSQRQTPSPELNCSPTFPVSQQQTPSPLGIPSSPPLSTAAAASPSPIEDEPSLTIDSEEQDLVSAIKRFEYLISATVVEIATKDKRIKHLRTEISNVMKNQKKVSTNLKRLQYKHLDKKISH